MKIDITKIENYANLSAEEKVKLLEGFEFEADNTDLKKMLSDRNSEIKKLKDEIKSKLSEDERKKQEAEEEMQKMRDELEKFKKDSLVASYKAKHLALGFDEDLATKKAELLAEGKINEAFEIDKQFLDAHDKKLKEDALRGMPNPSGGAKEKKVTKEEFSKMSYSEMLTLKKENPELYKELNKE